MLKKKIEEKLASLVRVTPTPYPFCIAWSITFLLTKFIFMLHSPYHIQFYHCIWYWNTYLIVLLFAIVGWSRRVIAGQLNIKSLASYLFYLIKQNNIYGWKNAHLYRNFTYYEYNSVNASQSYIYSSLERKNIKTGFCLFLWSEFMAFFALWWGWGHNAFVPSIWIGAKWPPVFFPHFSWRGLAFYNTLILFTSSCLLNWADLSVRFKTNRSEIVSVLAIVFFAGAHFIEIQCFEYIRSVISFRDSIYGCLFYSITGLHLFHVIMGMFFIFITGMRIACDPYIREDGLEFTVDPSKKNNLSKLLNCSFTIKKNLQWISGRHLLSHTLIYKEYNRNLSNLIGCLPILLLPENFIRIKIFNLQIKYERSVLINILTVLPFSKLVTIIYNKIFKTSFTYLNVRINWYTGSFITSIIYLVPFIIITKKFSIRREEEKNFFLIIFFIIFNFYIKVYIYTINNFKLDIKYILSKFFIFYCEYSLLYFKIFLSKSTLITYYNFKILCQLYNYSNINIFLINKKSLYTQFLKQENKLLNKLYFKFYNKIGLFSFIIVYINLLKMCEFWTLWLRNDNVGKFNSIKNIFLKKITRKQRLNHQESDYLYITKAYNVYSYKYYLLFYQNIWKNCLYLNRNVKNLYFILLYNTIQNLYFLIIDIKLLIFFLINNNTKIDLILISNYIIKTTNFYSKRITINIKKNIYLILQVWSKNKQSLFKNKKNNYSFLISEVAFNLLFIEWFEKKSYLGYSLVQYWDQTQFTNWEFDKNSNLINFCNFAYWDTFWISFYNSSIWETYWGKWPYALFTIEGWYDLCFYFPQFYPDWETAFSFPSFLSHDPVFSWDPFGSAPLWDISYDTFYFSDLRHIYSKMIFVLEQGYPKPTFQHYFGNFFKYRSHNNNFEFIKDKLELWENLYYPEIYGLFEGYAMALLNKFPDFIAFNVRLPYSYIKSYFCIKSWNCTTDWFNYYWSVLIMEEDKGLDSAANLEAVITFYETGYENRSFLQHAYGFLFLPIESGFGDFFTAFKGLLAFTTWIIPESLTVWDALWQQANKGARVVNLDILKETTTFEIYNFFKYDVLYDSYFELSWSYIILIVLFINFITFTSITFWSTITIQSKKTYFKHYYLNFPNVWSFTDLVKYYYKWIIFNLAALIWLHFWGLIFLISLLWNNFILKFCDFFLNQNSKKKYFIMWGWRDLHQSSVKRFLFWRVSSYYWHFVDGIWFIVYAIVYIM